MHYSCYSAATAVGNSCLRRGRRHGPMVRWLRLFCERSKEVQQRYDSVIVSVWKMKHWGGCRCHCRCYISAVACAVLLWLE